LFLLFAAMTPRAAAQDQSGYNGYNGYNGYYYSNPAWWIQAPSGNSGSQLSYNLGQANFVQPRYFQPNVYQPEFYRTHPYQPQFYQPYYYSSGYFIPLRPVPSR
jgi:hypothetical protein